MAKSSAPPKEPSAAKSDKASSKDKAQKSAATSPKPSNHQKSALNMAKGGSKGSNKSQSNSQLCFGALDMQNPNVQNLLLLAVILLLAYSIWCSFKRSGVSFGRRVRRRRSSC